MENCMEREPVPAETSFEFTPATKNLVTLDDFPRVIGTNTLVR